MRMRRWHVPGQTHSFASNPVLCVAVVAAAAAVFVFAFFVAVVVAAVL
jgi:hypothetical protein